MTTIGKLEAKLRKLNRRYKSLSRAHGIVLTKGEALLREMRAMQGRDPHLPSLADMLAGLLGEGKQSYKQAASTARSGHPSPHPATTPAPPPQTGPYKLPPAALAALKLARNSLLVRQQQLAACRTCGAEAEAYGLAVAELDKLLK